MNTTIRQQIITLLEQGAMDIEQLSAALDLREKETLTHLPHVARSLTARGRRLRVHPAVCSLCDFEFKDRRRLSPPGRCPRCKETRIRGPWYFIP